ncbi:Protein RCC2 -like protein [Halotydeus destructor]|nr:Protein RCC2 -like protein [Halotydeus destructor]
MFSRLQLKDGHRFRISKMLQRLGLLSGSIDDYVVKRAVWRLPSFISFFISFVVLVRFICIMYFHSNDSVVQVLAHDTRLGRQTFVTVTIILWAIYTVLMTRLYFVSQNSEKRWMNWLLPLQVVEGTVKPSMFGLDSDQAKYLMNRSRRIFGTMWLITLMRACFVSAILINYLHYDIESKTRQVTFALWAGVVILWSFISSGTVYMTLATFDVISSYFRIRFEKVNDAIQALIDTKGLTTDHRSKFMMWILKEHNHLCVRLEDYNHFFSKFMLYSYFGLIGISCFAFYQAIFSSLTGPIKNVMYIAAFEAFYVFMKVALNGSRVSHEAHAPYGLLIRATFFEYPVELQIQTRLLIQRLSGAPIGFYCSDLFEISRGTLYSAWHKPASSRRSLGWVQSKFPPIMLLKIVYLEYIMLNAMAGRKKVRKQKVRDDIEQENGNKKQKVDPIDATDGKEDIEGGDVGVKEEEKDTIVEAEAETKVEETEPVADDEADLENTGTECADAGRLLLCGSTNWDLTGRKELPKSMKGPSSGKNLWGPHSWSTNIRVKKVVSSCTAVHSVIITEGGRAMTVGRNDKGQLGHGDLVTQAVPKIVEVLKDHKVIDAATGKGHTLFLTDKGQVWACGDNKMGQLGVGTQTQSVMTPSKVSYTGKPIVKVACGGEFSMIVDAFGNLYTFGSPEHGQLGHNSEGKFFTAGNKIAFNCETTPRRVAVYMEKTREGHVTALNDVSIVDVACGVNHSVAVDSKKRCFTWGFAGYGRLGHSETKNEMVPRNLKHFDYDKRGGKRCWAGSTFCMVLDEMGLLYFWGQSKSSGEATMYPKTIPDLCGWNIRDVACANKSIVVIADNSTIAWGPSPTYGELGYGESKAKSSTTPQEVKPLDGIFIRSVSCGYGHTLLIAKDETEEDKKLIEKLPKWP